jgi:hypothetical protein
MLGIIKRVISGENMEEGQQPQSSNNINDNHHPPNSNGNTMPDSTFAIIENDDDNAMDLSDDHHHQHSNHEDDNHTIGSSISDVSAAKGNDSEDVHLLMVPSDHPMVVMDETSSPTHRPPPAPRTTAALVSSIPKPSHLDRSDSRNSNDSYSSIGRQSSQNSSRDWGWFEETEHGSGPFAASKQPPPQRAPLNKEEEAFLVQQLQQAAAASANNNNNMMIDEDPSSKRKKGDKKKKGTSMLLPHLTLTASEDMLMMDEETQQVLLDPPTDFESGKSNETVTSCLVGTMRWRTFRCLTRDLWCTCGVEQKGKQISSNNEPHTHTRSSISECFSPSPVLRCCSLAVLVTFFCVSSSSYTRESSQNATRTSSSCASLLQQQHHCVECPCADSYKKTVMTMSPLQDDHHHGGNRHVHFSMDVRVIQEEGVAPHLRSHV